MSNDPKSAVQELKKILTDPLDLDFRAIESKDNAPVQIAFLRGLADPAPVINILTQNNLDFLTQDTFGAAGKIPATVSDTPPESFLYRGATLIFLPDREPFVVLTTSITKRLPVEPANELAIRGPRDGFTEDIYDSLGLIRRRLPDPNLKADETIIGRRTQTRIAIVYLEDVANPGLVAEVKKRLAKIDIDGVLAAGYLEEFIKDNKLSTLPLAMTSERPDKVTGSLLEGRVAILVDQSPQVIIVPVALNDFYQTPDDYYFDFWGGSLVRIVRFIGNFLAVGLSGFYIALVGSSPQLLPIGLALTIAGFRVGVTFPLYLEVMIAEIFTELLREAGLRLPRGTNQTLGAAVGIIIGFALIQTGYISNPTAIIVGVSAIASFSSPNYSVGLTWRILKYIIIFTSSILGLYGFFLGLVFILAHLAGLTSFGTPYLTPWGPWQSSGALDSLIRAPIWLNLKRPQSVKPQQSKRGKKYPNQE